MAGGRPRKVTEINKKHMTKAEQASRKEQESKLGVGRDELNAPSFLDFEGKREFDRVIRQATQLGVIDNLDLSVLAIYAQAWEQYCECSRIIKHEGILQTKENAFGKYTVVSPVVQAQEKYIKTIMQCSTKLGLAVTDRMKLVAPVQEEKEENRYLKHVKTG